MSAISLIFPHQLFEHHPAITKDRIIYLIEEHLFFNQYKFHQQKILLHRASMKWYADWLKEQGYQVLYIESLETNASIKNAVSYFAQQQITAIHFCEVVDNWLNKRLKKAAREHQIQLIEHTTPQFLTTLEQGKRFFESKKSYHQTAFYIFQRKRLKLLLDANENPLGGKWSFDVENRKKFPTNGTLPKYTFPHHHKYIDEAIDYVNKYFKHHYGSTNPPFKQLGGKYYPTNFSEAKNWLQDFLKHRLEKFGDYEDAMVANETILFHSLLSPILNIGLLTPQYVIAETLAYASKHTTPLNAVEGFIRQIIGWREFVRIVYELEGSKQRTTNYWGFKRNIPISFWNGSTGIVPIDKTIEKVLTTAYNHHIERLMILGNFMLLCEFHPDEVYKWFMEMYIDAYDWVMVPNVYGMTQFADGGLMTTKPYISSSNYLFKMGDWKKTASATNNSWEKIWDALFWRFIHVHQSYFRKNPRLGMLLKTFDKMPKAKQIEILETAEKFLDKLEQ